VSVLINIERQRKMSLKNRHIKVLMAKTSLDGHWRGPLVVARAMRDAGMEVIYIGESNPYQIVQAAIQEDADVIGLNIGSRYYQIGIIKEELKKKKVKDVLLIAGGNRPPEDIPSLKEMGVAGVFPPGSSLDSIVNFISDNVKLKERKSGS
jgi:methylmalonyl-CoA mutase C-terminal domain/subunit